MSTALRHLLPSALVSVLIAIGGAGCAPTGGGGGDAGNGGGHGNGNDTPPPDQEYLPPAPAVYAIQTDGQPREIARQTLTTTGGTISAADGFTIEVSADALGAAATLVVTTQSITSHDLPENVTVVTPLYDVRGMETLATDFMTVSVPMEVGDGEFPAVVNWSPETGRAEVLPLVEYDGAAAKVVTRHFSVYVGIKLPISFLQNLDYSTNFRAGHDDWQFGNFVAWDCPGVCMGMTASSIWYFETLKTENMRGLRSQYQYGKYGYNREDTPNFTEDDDVGRRLVAMVQRDGRDDEWRWYYYNNPPALGGRQLTSDELMLLEVATALVIEEAPQYLAANSRDRSKPHAITCSGIQGNTLYCVDPNYPGLTKSLTLDAERHEWIPYDNIVQMLQYVTKSSTATWEIMPALWEQMKNGTIGDDVFPQAGYYISLRDPDTGEISNSRELSLLSINEVDTPKVSFFAAPEQSLDYTVFRLNEDSIDELYSKYADNGSVNPAGMASLTLSNEEPVTIGILAQLPVAGKKRLFFEYLDFKWFTVEYVAEVEPPPDDGATGPTSITFQDMWDVYTFTLSFPDGQAGGQTVLTDSEVYDTNEMVEIQLPDFPSDPAYWPTDSVRMGISVEGADIENWIFYSNFSKSDWSRRYLITQMTEEIQDVRGDRYYFIVVYPPTGPYRTVAFKLTGTAD